MGQEIDRTHFSETDSRQFACRLAEETAALRSFAEAGGFADARYVAGFELEAWLLDHAGLSAGDCLYVDDVSANCAAAEALGFRAIHYEIAGFDLVTAIRGMLSGCP